MSESLTARTLLGTMESRPPTVHDILGTIEGLRSYSKTLREAATSPVHDIEGQGTGILADPVALAEIAVWMEEAGAELLRLVPDGPLIALTGKKRFRTLVRIIGYDMDTGAVQAVLPGWEPETVVKIPAVDSEVNEYLGNMCHEDAPPTEDAPVRLHAWVNLHAVAAEDLEFSDWETP